MLCNDREKEHEFLGNGSVNKLPRKRYPSYLLDNGSVNMPLTMGVLLETMFSVLSVQSSDGNRQSSSGVPSERLIESWEDAVDRVQLRSVNQRATA
jgi:hypothetical protein